MKLTLLFVVLLALILEVLSLGEQEHDSRHIPRKVSFISLTKKKKKLKLVLNNINSEAVNKKK